MSKVLILNGSPRVNGNTSIAVREMENVFRNSGVEVTTIQIGNKDIRGCIACNQCSKIGKCVFDDIVNELAPLFEAADGLVIASPVYYASANATLIACLDRLFYSTSFDKSMKAFLGGAWGKRLGVEVEDVKDADGWLERTGRSAVFFCRFVPIIRSLISIPAGMAKMELLPFLLLTTAGSLIWNTVLIGAGAVAGASWERILVLLKTYSRFAVMGAGILGFAVACVYFRKR